MNFPYFVSKRITAEDKQSFSSTISRLAVVSIAVGLSIMILSFFILGGFQRKIKNKIYNFKGHLEVTKFDLSSSYNEKPIIVTQGMMDSLMNYDFVDHVQRYAHKSGMIKTNDEVEGIFFKGVGKQFSVDRFKNNMVEGEFVHIQDSSYAKEIVISRWLANRLSLSINDNVIIYFVQNPPRYRKLKIVGFYETGLEEVDHAMILGDIRLIQKLNNWSGETAGGIEVFVKDETLVDLAYEELFERLDATFYVEKVSRKYAQIFDWLSLLRQNVAIFLFFILLVACVNMISILLILIMERTNMIGILQALGSSRSLLKKIFFYNGMSLIIKGLLIGNGVALILAVLQDQFHLIPLDPDTYYMNYVPIFWDFESLILLNLLTFSIVTLTLVVPLLFISRISPISALKFD